LKHQYIDVLVLVCLTVLYTVSNGILDSIDHHKGAAVLCDFWHVVKQVDRVLLLSIGICITRIPWRWWSVLLAGACLPVLKYLWSYIYSTYWHVWVHIDNTWNISTGIDYLDKLFGLDKCL